MHVLDRDQIGVEPGDILCLWTGLDQLIMDGQGNPDSAILQWISQSGVAAIASDNLAVEAFGKPIPPNYQGSSLPLHENCLFKLGVHLGALWYLADLAHWLRLHNRSCFLLTAPPLRLPGAVGSPLTPVATF